MIVETVILLGVKNLEQGRCWITTIIHPHFVDFIEKKQRVSHADLGQLLEQLPWQ